jgi:hypothetical protein
LTRPIPCVCLAFPKDLVKEPILRLLAKPFDVIFNIHSSTITADLELVGVGNKWQRDRSRGADQLAQRAERLTSGQLGKSNRLNEFLLRGG